MRAAIVFDTAQMAQPGRGALQLASPPQISAAAQRRMTMCRSK